MKYDKRFSTRLKINFIPNSNFIAKTEMNKDKLYRLSVQIPNQISLPNSSKINKIINIKSNNLSNIKTRNSNFFSNIKRKSVDCKALISMKKTTDSFKSQYVKSHINKNANKRLSVIINRNNIKNNIKRLNTFSNKNIRTIQSSKSLINNIKIYKNKNIINSTKIINSKEKEKEKEKEYNPFEVEEEDKIFKKIMKIKKKKKKQKKLKLFNSHDAPLSKVYKNIPYILTQLNKVKKLKNNMSLAKYQKTLFDVGSQVLNRDLTYKLNLKFSEIRRSTEKKYDYFEGEIDSIEEKEKKIIKKINTQQNFFKNIMVKNNKSKWVYGISKKVDFFPNINFYPTPRYLLYNNH